MLMRTGGASAAWLVSLLLLAWTCTGATAPPDLVPAASSPPWYGPSEGRGTDAPPPYGSTTAAKPSRDGAGGAGSDSSEAWPPPPPPPAPLCPEAAPSPPPVSHACRLQLLGGSPQAGPPPVYPPAYRLTSSPIYPPTYPPSYSPHSITVTVTGSLHCDALPRLSVAEDTTASSEADNGNQQQAVEVELGAQLYALHQRGAFGVTGSVIVAPRARRTLGELPAGTASDSGTQPPSSGSGGGGEQDLDGSPLLPGGTGGSSQGGGDSSTEGGDGSSSGSDGISSGSEDSGGGGGGGGVVDDWGVTFIRVPHLLLNSSSVSGVPLSTVNPLLLCSNCSYLTLSDVSFKHLRRQQPSTQTAAASSGGGHNGVVDGMDTAAGAVAVTTIAFGALAATGLLGVSVHDTNCTDVHATIWACLLLQVQPQSGSVDVRLHNSRFLNNSAAAVPEEIVGFSSIATALGIPFIGCAGSHDPASTQFGAVAVMTPVVIPQDAPPLDPDERQAEGEGTPTNDYGCIEVDVSGCSFDHNVGGRGGGLALVLPTGHLALRLTDTNMTWNQALSPQSGKGGAVSACVEDGAYGSVSFVRVTTSILSHNTAYSSGGAIWVSTEDWQAGGIREATFNAVLMEGNTAMDFGAAVHLASETGIGGITFRGSRFVSNEVTSQKDGAVFLDSTNGRYGSLVVSNTSFIANRGGAVYVKRDSGPLDLLLIDGGSVLADNSCPSGGALFANKVTNVTVAASTFTRNSANRSGGALYLGGVSSATFSYTTFTDNNASRGDGGGVYLQSDADDFNIAIGPDVRATGNRAENGGFMNLDTATISGLRLERCHLSGNVAVTSEDSALVGSGGAIYVGAKAVQSVTVTASSMTDHNAINGGALYVTTTDTVGSVTFHDTSLERNSAVLAGGAMFLYAPSGIELIEVLGSNSSISSNTAGSGGGVGGGGFYIRTGSRGSGIGKLRISGGAKFEKNSVFSNVGSGGAIHVSCEAGNITEMETSGAAMFRGNVAGVNGGALYLHVNQVPTDAILTDANNILTDTSLVGFTRLHVSGGSVFSGNRAVLGRGGAVFARSGNTDPQRLKAGRYIAWTGQLSIAEGSVFARNNASSGGGGIFLDGFFSASLSDSAYSFNVASLAGGGGAIGFNRFPPALNVVASTFSANEAQRGSGGAISIEVSPQEFQDGSVRDSCLRCIMVRDDLPVFEAREPGASLIKLTSSNFTGNTVFGDGGAIHLKLNERCCSGVVQLDVRNSSYSANRANGAGGAISFHNPRNPYLHTALTATLTDSTFSSNVAGKVVRGFSNSASQGGALFVWNARAYDPVQTEDYDISQDCNITVARSAFGANVCQGGYGGAVMLAACVSNLVDTVFSNNSATLGAGAMASLHFGFLEGLEAGLLSSSNQQGQRRRSMRGGWDAGRSVDATPAATAGTAASSLQAVVLPYAGLGSSGGGGGLGKDAFGTATATGQFVARQGLRGATRTGRHRLQQQEQLSTPPPPEQQPSPQQQQPSVGGNLTAAGFDLPGCGRLWYAWLHNCTFNGNSCDLEYGGGLYLDGQQYSHAVLDACHFDSNSAQTKHGGGAFLAIAGTCSAINVTSSTFANNNASDTSGSAGALYLLLGRGGSRANVSASTFTANRAAYAGAVEAYVFDGANVDLHTCHMTGNVATRDGGAVLAEVSCGAKVTVTGGNMTGNSAGQAGGALAVTQFSAPGRCLDGSAVVWSGAVATGNTAGTFGGSLYVAPGSAANVRRLTSEGDRAGRSGGSVAAQNCSLLTVTDSSVRGSGASRTGGGVFAEGCNWVLLDRVGVTDCTAGMAGGGVHLAGPEAANITLTATGGASAGHAILSGVTLARNEAGNLAEDDPAIAVTDAAAASDFVEDSSSRNSSSGRRQLATSSTAVTFTASTTYISRGGSLFVEGPLAVALSVSDMSNGNAAMLGSAFASTQRCNMAASNNANEAAVETPTGPQAPANTDLARWASAWAALGRASAQGCWALALTNTLLPLGAADAANTTTNSSSSQITNTTTPALPLWMQDLTASALQAACSAETDEQVQIQQALLIPGREGGGAATQGKPQLPDTSVATDAIIAALDYIMRPPPANATSQVLLSRHRRLRAALAQCVPPPPQSSDGSGGSRSSAYSVGLPPTQMRLSVAQGGVVEKGGDWLLQPGSPFTASVLLLDQFGEPVMSDMATIRITLQLMPRTPNGAPFNASAADDSRPWRNATAANLDPGPLANSSLTQGVAGGRATWREVVPRGWPGAYHLLFTADVFSQDTGVQEVAPLRVAAELLSCLVGETLDLETAQQQDAPSWTSCSSCRQGQYGLWQDQRPLLTEYRTTNYLLLMNETANQALDEDASCSTCTENAACPGAAVLVPALGYWHSAPNSTAVHACPNPEACGDGVGDGDWAGPVQVIGADGYIIVPYDAVLQDARSQLLGRCQKDWYGSVPQGADATAAYYANRNSTGAGVGTGEGQGGDAMACLLWGLPTDDPHSYMQRQCAKGYTGNLCATCVRGYYVNSDFECQACPTIGRTVTLGLLAFFGNVLLILSTTYTNFRDAAEDEEADRGGVEPGEVVKAMVLHIQYFIIITRLNIDYPESITKCQAVLNSMTGAENYIAYSPSCLVPGLDSAGQAQVQLLAGLLTPVAVALLCLGIWALRYRFGHTALVRRVKGGRMAFHQTPNSMRRATWIDRLRVSLTPGSATAPGVATSFSAVLSIERPPSMSTYGPVRDTGLSGVGVGGSNLELGDSVAGIGSAPIGDSTRGLTGSMPRSGSASGVASNAQQFQSYLYPQHQASAGRSAGGVLGGGGGSMGAAGAWQGGSSARPLAEGMDGGADAAADVAAEAATAAATMATAATAASEGLACGDQAGREGGLVAVTVGSTRHPAGFAGGDGTHGTSLYASSRTDGSEHAAFVAAAVGRETWQIPKTSTAADTGSGVKTRRQRTRDALEKVKARALSFVEPHLKRRSALVHVDQTLSMLEQLAIVLMVSVFVLYPGLAQAALSVFACYRVDTGNGNFPEAQQATWPHGYWVRDMQQECYSGVHLGAYLPIGVVAVLLYCLAPPAVSFVLMWRKRKKLEVHHVGQVYGFLFKRYRPQFFYWESVLQLETLALVAVEVFGRALATSHQALMLLAVFLVIGAINMSCSPMRSHFLVMLEFLSLSVLSLTVTLGLYFVVGDQVQDSAGTAVGAIILVINAGLLFCFLALATVTVWPSLVESAKPRLQAGLQRINAALGGGRKFGIGGCLGDTEEEEKTAGDGREQAEGVGNERRGGAEGEEQRIGGSWPRGQDAEEQERVGTNGGYGGREHV